MDAYTELLGLAKEIMAWQSIQSILHWDFETYMPPGAAEQRGMQLSMLSSLIHEKTTMPRVGKLLDEVINGPTFENLTKLEKRNVHLIKRSHDQQTRLPADLVAEIAKQQAISVSKWKQAKEKQDFRLFKPELEKTIELVKKKAHFLDPDKDPYDVLLDLYEPGISTRDINRVFGPLRDGLIPLVKKYGNREKGDLSFKSRRVPASVQRTIGQRLMDFMHFDTRFGRLDETEHPFTTGMYEDVRICTHYHDDNFLSSIYSILHEGGHALYEMNIPKDYWWQPVGSSCSMGIHESQSRMVENVIGRSREFWTFFLPVLRSITGPVFDDVELDQVLEAVNDVKPSKIRIEADEVTYSLHVILRFEMEQIIIGEKASVDELPGIWNEMMESYLGVEITNDSEGILQDTHWASGYFGYFPDYALGNVYDGMFLEKIDSDVPEWRNRLEQGDIMPVLGWLKEHVHQEADLQDPLDLVKKVTGKSIDAAPFLEYLEQKMASVLGP